MQTTDGATKLQLQLLITKFESTIFLIFTFV